MSITVFIEWVNGPVNKLAYRTQGKPGQQLKVFIAKPDKLSLTPRTHTIEGGTLKFPLSYLEFLRL